MEVPTGSAAVLRLYDVSNPANAPALLDRKLWATNESGNGVYAGAVNFGGNVVYALNSDNGIMAFSLISGAAPLLAPFITQNPGSASAALLNNATFTGAADGNPAPTYRWFFNTNTPVANATNFTLVVTNIQPANLGAYDIVASNSSGVATSQVANLTEAIAFKNGQIYEPFNYTPGFQLQGQGGWVTNTISQRRCKSFVQAGNLSAPGLPASTGNFYSWSNNITIRSACPSARVTNGPVYFSFAFPGLGIHRRIHWRGYLLAAWHISPALRCSRKLTRSSAGRMPTRSASSRAAA